MDKGREHDGGGILRAYGALNDGEFVIRRERSDRRARRIFRHPEEAERPMDLFFYEILRAVGALNDSVFVIQNLRSR